MRKFRFVENTKCVEQSDDGGKTWKKIAENYTKQKFHELWGLAPATSRRLELGSSSRLPRRPETSRSRSSICGRGVEDETRRGLQKSRPRSIDGRMRRRHRDRD